jgi:hypothetical protein
MDDVLAALREAFEVDGYDTVEVSRNRDTVRVAVREEGADAERLRSLVAETVTDGSVLGVNVTAESIEGADGTNTVVTFRYRE